MKALSGAIVFAITIGVIKAIDNYVHRVEKAREVLEETTTELTNVEDELKSIGRQIDEILAKDKLELTDKEALKRLQLENEELERRKILLEAQQEADAADLNAKIEDKYKKAYRGNLTAVHISVEDGTYFNDVTGKEETRYVDKEISKEEYINRLIARYDELLGLQRKLTDEEKAEAEEIRNVMIEEGNKLSEMTDGYTAVTEKQREIKAGWEAIIADAARVASTYPGTAVDITERLKEKLAYDTGLTGHKRLNQSFSSWIDSLSDKEKKIMIECELDNPSLEQAKAYLAEQLSLDMPEYRLSDIFDLDDTDLGKISESIDKIQNAYTTLNDAIDEYNEAGYLSIDTIQDVVSLGSGYLDYLVDEEGNLRLDKAALQQLTIARLRDMQAQTLQELASQVENIKNETDANEFAAQSYREKAQGISMVTEELLKQKVALLDVSEQEKKTVLDAAVKQMNQINALFDSAVAGVVKNPKGAIGSSGSSSSSASNSKETFDWVETALSRIQRTITNLGKVVSGTYRKWSTRNNALTQELAAVNQEIATQQTAYSAYMSKANSVGLSDHYKQLVMNGGMNVEDITDDTLKEQINNFKTYYEKALDASDAIEDLRANIADLAKTKFDNLSAQYDAEISVIEHYTSMLDGFISQSETAGYMASEVYYEALADKQNENIDKLKNEYSTLLSAFDEAVQSGAIEKYSEDWYGMYQSINDVEQALQAATTQLIEYNQTMQQLSWDAFDRIQEYTNNINDEANFLIDILDAYDSHADNGKLTEHGLAIQGLHAVNYNVYMEQAAAYAEELAKIEKEMADDPYDMELIDRRNELLGLQQDAISNAMAEKEAIVDLASAGYDKMLDSLQQLIDKRKEALQAEKDLYDYQRDIEDKTSTIASYKKQLEAYKDDNSEESKSTIQKLELSLKDAERDLEETEYNKWLSDQEALLDDLYSQTEQWINQRLDNIDGLVAEAVVATNNNASTISETIYNASSSYGYQLSSKMDEVWNLESVSLDELKNVVGIYGDVLYGIAQTVDGDINATRDALIQHIGDSDVIIGAKIDANGNIVGTSITSGFSLIDGKFVDIVDTDKLINSSILNSTTTVCDSIKGIRNDMATMIEKLDKIAQENTETVASAQNQVVTNQASNNIPVSTPVTTPASTTTTNTSEQPAAADKPLKTEQQTSNVDKSYIVRDKDTGRVYASGLTKEGCSSWASSHNYNIVNWSGKAAEVRYKGQTTTTTSKGGGGGKNVMMAYASGTTNAVRGRHIVGENGKELIIRNDNTLALADGAQLYDFKGGETVLNAQDTSRVLTPLNEQAIIGGLLKRNYSSGVGAFEKSATNISNDISMNITLPNVTDYDSFVTKLKTDKRFEKIVQTMTVGNIAGKNSLSKNKL